MSAQDTAPVAEPSLKPGAVCAAAMERAGIDRFEDEGFREPLQVLLDSLDREAKLTPAGRAGQFERNVDLLVDRLRAEDWLRRHPEIRDENLGAPVVIVGLMRTGTTLLHRLLACDERFFAPRWYEVRHPAPFPGGEFTVSDARIPAAEAEVAQMLAGNPDLAAVHPLQATGVDEEVLLLEQSFYSTVPESFAWVPGYARWLENHDNTPGYRYLHLMLQFLQWQKKRAGQRADRWLLKTPHHLHHLDILLREFPGATIIQTHRDPLETIPSLCSMNCALAALGSDEVDPVAMGRHWYDKFVQSLERADAVRERHPEAFIDVHYRDTVQDPLDVAQRIYTHLGLELDAATRTSMTQWLEGNRRQDRAAHRYSLEQFGFDRRSLEEDFAGYRRRYLAAPD